MIAHELGHLNHGDGRLALALRRLTPPPISLVTFDQMGCLPLLAMFFNGGLGLLLTGWLWNRHWQKRELLADRFAFACGQATGLIEILDLYGFFDVAVPFGAVRRDHPHNEKRIDELMRLIRTKAELEARLRVLEAELRESDAEEQETAGKSREPEAEPGAEGQRRDQVLLDLAAKEWELDRKIAVLKLEQLKREAARSGRKGGFTDAEAILDFVFVDESHADWATPGQIDEEKAWVQANGERLVNVVHYGTATVGRGFLTVTWTPDNESRRTAEATFNSHAEFLKAVHNPVGRLGVRRDKLDWARWDQYLASYDADRSFVLTVVRLGLAGETRGMGITWWQCRAGDRCRTGYRDDGANDRVIEVCPVRSVIRLLHNQRCERHAEKVKRVEPGRGLAGVARALTLDRIAPRPCPWGNVLARAFPRLPADPQRQGVRLTPAPAGAPLDPAGPSAGW